MSSVVVLTALVVLAAGLVVVESGPNRSRELSLIAALAAAAAAGRVLFAFVPNVQPVTMLVAVTGITLGARAGIATGAAAALVSNAFLGQGPWTPWQMLGWAAVGATAAFTPGLRNRFALAAFGLVWGFLFDWLMDVWAWSSLGPSATAGSFTALAASGVWFDIAHAAGNVAIALVAGPTLIRILDRYARRIAGSFAPLEGT
jgi:energy-coupling factor transport system substrate-specific component